MKAVMLATLLVLVAIVNLSMGQTIFIRFSTRPTYIGIEGQSITVDLTSVTAIRYSDNITVEVTAVFCDSQNKATDEDFKIVGNNKDVQSFNLTLTSLRARSSSQVIEITRDQKYETAVGDARERFCLEITKVTYPGNDIQISQRTVGQFVNVDIIDINNVSVSFESATVMTVNETGTTPVKLRVRARGIYSNDLSVGVRCQSADSTNTQAATPGIDFIDDIDNAVEFKFPGAFETVSDDFLINIINDNITEGDEALVCVLLAGILTELGGGILREDPDTIDILIRDDDQFIVKWEKPLYEIRESDGQLEVALITDSVLQNSIAVATRPTAINSNLPEERLSFVPGSNNQRVTINTTGLDITGLDLTGEFGKAQIVGFEEIDDILETEPDFLFNMTMTRSTVKFEIIDDDILEYDEIAFAPFVFSQEVSSTYKIQSVAPINTLIIITDDDRVEINFKPTVYTVNEGDGKVNLLLEITGRFDRPLTATIGCKDGTAINGSDYLWNTTVFTYQSNTDNPTLTDDVPVEIINDDMVELPEFFICEILSTTPTGGKFIIGDSFMANVTIIDDDPISVIFDPETYEVVEGNTAVLRLITNIAYDFDFLVEVDTSDITTTSIDYQPGGYLVNFTASPTGPGIASFSIKTFSDNVLEEREEFLTSLSIPQEFSDRVQEGSPSMAMVEIIDNTTAIVFFDPDFYTVKEGLPAELFLRINATLDKNVTVTVEDKPNSAITPEDYERGPKTAVFTVGNEMTSVVFETVSDNIIEGVESFNANIIVSPQMMAMGVFPGVPDTAVVLIDDSENVTVTFERSSYTITEDSVSLEVGIRATGALKDSYPLVVTATMGTAVEGKDWDGLVFMVTMPANEREATFSINITDDFILELRENFTIELNEPTTANVQRGDPYEAIITIIDDDPITVSWEDVLYIVDEADGTVEVALTASGIADFDYNVTVESMDVEAVNFEDYNFNTASVVFKKGSARQALNIIILEDNIDELNETFTLTETITNVPDIVAGDPTITTAFPDVTTVLIIDNEDITARFNPENYTETEGSSVNLTVVLDKPPAKDVTVIITTMEITATPNSDYESKTCVVIIPAEMLSGVCIVDLFDDSTIEDPEHFKATLTIPGGQPDVIPGDPDVAFVTIVDNETILVRWEQDMYMLSEADESINVTLISSKPASFSYDVTVTAMDVTATDPEDYHFDEIMVTFPNGETTVSINVPVNNDDINEMSETFDLQIAVNELEARVLPGTPDVTTILIKDDDNVFVMFDPQNYTVVEGSSIPITVVLDKPAAKEVIVTIDTTAGGNAEDPKDYQFFTCEVTFEVGDTTNSDCMIMAKIDEELEGDEYLIASLSIQGSPSDVLPGDPEIAFVTIKDMPPVTDEDNATIIGDPLFEVPLPNPEDYEDDPALKDASLCYEVHGNSGEIFNLISDGCTSVNALYKEGVLPNTTDLNFMSKIGIAADGVTGQCHTLEFDVDGCKAFFDGLEVPLNGISSDDRIRVRRRGSEYTYIISVPNCGTARRLMMWVSCVNTTRLGEPRDDGLHFRVLYADGLQPTSHGLLGQFWNIPLNVTKYNGPFGDKPMSQNAYTVTISPPGSNTRSFVAHRGPRLWDTRRKPCLYAGNIHGGPAGEVEEDGSVIEGKYTDYKVNNLFSINLENPDFSKYTGMCAEPGTPSPG